MPALTTTAERIIRQPALTMPGNATGAEAACTSLTASQIRTLLSLATTSDVTFDIVRATTSVQTPLVSNAAALTLGNSTHGVTVPGNAVISTSTAAPLIVRSSNNGHAMYLDSTGAIGNAYYGFQSNGSTKWLIGWQRTDDAMIWYNAGAANGRMSLTQAGWLGVNTLSPSGIFHVDGTNATNVYIESASISNQLLNAGGTFTVKNISGTSLLSIAESTGAATFSGDISMLKATQGYIRAYGTGGVNNITMYDDNTNGILSTSSGNINLVPGGGTVAVTGGITASDLVTIDGPTGASGGVTSLNITDGANATFRLSFENANRIMLSGNEGAHNLSFGGKSGNPGTSPFTERFRVDNVANQVVSYSPFICTSITASGGATITGGGVSSTGGLKVGSYGASIGGIWNSTLTPSTSNYALAATATTSHLNATTSVSLAIGGTDVLYSTATGMAVTPPLTITGFNPGFVTKVADYTLTSSDHTVNVTANSVTITFETAVGCSGREHEVKNTGAGTVTLNTTSAQTIDGSASGALTLAQWKSIRVKSDGSNWLIMSQIT